MNSINGIRNPPPPIRLNLKLEQSSSTEIMISLKPPPETSSTLPINHIFYLREGPYRKMDHDRYPLPLGLNNKDLGFALPKLRVPLTPGVWYEAAVEVIDLSNRLVALGVARFKAVFNRKEIGKLYDLAQHLLRPSIGPNPYNMQRFEIFYRNKPGHYYANHIANTQGIMIKYRKDWSGHAASPINGELDGLFFHGRLINGQLPTESPFGPVRFLLVASYLLSPWHRLYFCDFYCNTTSHYVTVVACIPGSSADQFCHRYLLPLDPANNPFLIVRPNPYTGVLEHYIRRDIWVEFFYTENVSLNWGHFTEVPSYGTSKPGGVPNTVNLGYKKPQNPAKKVSYNRGFL